MLYRASLCVALVASLTLVAAANGDENATSASATRFDALKKLAGDWVQIGKDGKPTDKVVSSFRVTAGGTVVQETLFPGSDHEMVTMYHLDGQDLMLTHYCMLGNQPRMKAEPGPDTKRLAFRFVGSTNLKSSDENHMHEATLTLAGDDRFQAEWVSCKDGQECHKVGFDLVRKPK